jgi:hypothetical protein
MPLEQHAFQPPGRCAQPVPPHAPQLSAQQIGLVKLGNPVRQSSFDIKDTLFFLADSKMHGGAPHVRF